MLNLLFVTDREGHFASDKLAREISTLTRTSATYALSLEEANQALNSKDKYDICIFFGFKTHSGVNGHYNVASANSAKKAVHNIQTRGNLKTLVLLRNESLPEGVTLSRSPVYDISRKDLMYKVINLYRQKSWDLSVANLIE